MKRLILILILLTGCVDSDLATRVENDADDFAAAVEAERLRAAEVSASRKRRQNDADARVIADREELARVREREAEQLRKIASLTAELAELEAEPKTQPTRQVQPTRQPTRQARPKPAAGKLTAANYARVRTGMTFAEVVRILGADYSVMSEVDFPGVAKAKTVMWKNLGGIQNCNITFSDGRVTIKAQFGLN